MRNFLFILISIPFFSNAQYGILDTSFGENGIAVHSIELPFANSGKIKTDSNGNIYFLGSYTEFEEEVGEEGTDLRKFFLMKLFPDGTLDVSFGENGYVKYEIPYGWTDAADLEILNNEHILIVGNFERVSEWVDEQNNIFLVRFNLDGTLDDTFGMNGLYFDPFEDVRRAHKLICKEGVCFILESEFMGAGFHIEKRFFNGDTDFSFGTAGIVSFIDGGMPNGAGHFDINDQNEFFIIHWYDYINRYYIKKLNSNGELINQIYFNQDVMTPKSINFFQNKIYLGGRSNGNFGVRVYNSDLTVNENFGQNGAIEKDLGFEDQSGIDLIVGENGRLTQVGYVIEGNEHHFGLVGYYSNGTTDNTFGEAGITITDVTSHNYDVPVKSILVAPDKLLILNSSSYSVGFSLAQYTIYDGLSVEDISSDSKIKIAPNPTTNSFIISGLDRKQNNVQILDLTGKNIQKFSLVQNYQTLNLSSIPKGTYIIKIHSGNKIETKKLIVK